MRHFCPIRFKYQHGRISIHIILNLFCFTTMFKCIFIFSFSNSCILSNSVNFFLHLLVVFDQFSIFFVQLTVLLLNLRRQYKWWIISHGAYTGANSCYLILVMTKLVCYWHLVISFWLLFFHCLSLILIVIVIYVVVSAFCYCNYFGCYCVYARFHCY